MLVPSPHPATLDPDELRKDCKEVFGRTAGPGGQHRNKVETAASLTHVPTGLKGQAGERRKQQENRAVALRRLRLLLARECRTEVDPRRYRPSELWRSRRQGRTMSVNPKHKDYPALLAEALDLIVSCNFDVAGSAGILGVSMSQLAKLIRHDGKAFTRLNAGREKLGLPALK